MECYVKLTYLHCDIDSHVNKFIYIYIYNIYIYMLYIYIYIIYIYICYIL